ncbi:MAG TPA: response regulator [Kofleriaceae bacterium]|nr:response regulator [Kofleriaceae bacterium]
MSDSLEPEEVPQKRILFVDDEPAVLDGLRNLLRKQRRTWKMTFTLGGKAALEALEKETFDVVVSDMRMPGMDGAELLGRVKELYPAVARVVLSGHADQEMVTRALPVSQQYLSKPCDGEVLRGVIERVCALQALVAGTAVREIVGRLDKLPSIPETYWRLTRAIENPAARTDEISRIVQRDPAMSAKVLQLVNSAYFGLNRPLSSIDQAISYLGIDLLKGLALTLNVFAAHDAGTRSGLSLEELQRRSILTARIAKQMVSDPKDGEAAFSAGLLHEIGAIILGLAATERCAEVIGVAAGSGRPTHEVEQELLGVTHAQIGGYLLGVWGLPLPIVEAVAYHHVLPPIPRDKRDTAAVIHVASALATCIIAEQSGHPVAEQLDQVGLEAAGVMGNLPRWRELAAREADKLAEANERSA